MEPTDLTIEILKSIRDETVRGLNARIDNVLTGPMGTRVREHEERLGAIESRLAGLESHR